MSFFSIDAKDSNGAVYDEALFNDYVLKPSTRDVLFCSSRPG